MTAKHQDNFPGMNEQAMKILDSIGDAIIAIDRMSRVIYVNEELGLLLGRDARGLIGKNVADLIPEAGGWMFYMYLKRTMSERVQVKLENFMFFNKRFTAYFYPGKNVITILLHDITTQWHVDELYRLALFLLDRLSESVYLVRSDGRLFHVNDEVSRLLGYSRDELIHMKVFDIDPKITADGWESYFTRIKEKVHVDFESALRDRDGRNIPVDISANYVKLYGNEYYCVAARDITERKLVEKDLYNARAQAELYLDLLGHDINNMNQVGMGYLELLESSTSMSLSDKALVDKSMEALRNSSNLIKNVRKLQSISNHELKYKGLDACELLEEVKSEHSNMPDRQVAINLSLYCDCVVNANELLKDVFRNIVGNAIRHSSGPVTIDIKSFNAYEEGRKYCKVTIEDNGPGIPDAIKNKLFTRLQRGITKAEGKGLGLYLSKCLVEDYGGRMWVEDRVPGDHTKGSRFVVMLPAIND
jgi:PAS domain S-box-containing protein